MQTPLKNNYECDLIILTAHTLRYCKAIVINAAEY